MSPPQQEERVPVAIELVIDIATGHAGQVSMLEDTEKRLVSEGTEMMIISPQ